MKTAFLCVLLAAFHAVFCAESYALEGDRYLVINFDCHGEAFGKSAQFGDSLRYRLWKEGAEIVSNDLLFKLVSKGGYNGIDLNYVLDDLKSVMTQLNADAAVYGHVLSSYDLLTLELRMIERNQQEPIIFDPIVCGSSRDIFSLMPEIARLILAPDKSIPRVLSVEPENAENGVEQYVDMTITFSKPMNPSTYSITGYPENMWTRFGGVTYDEKTYAFVFKLHLYPGIEYEFHVNGAERKGFKDESGNVASEFVWKFTTGRW
jgi:hypothetical protein